jgi:hypothetical protein
VVLEGFYRLLYVSRAFVDPCGDAPRDILDVATMRNASLGVTGVLCFSGDHFAQLLEGPIDALGELMTSIRADSRHRILREWPAEAAADARWFPTWAMGYVYDERIQTLVQDLCIAQKANMDLNRAAQPLFLHLEWYRGHIL